MRYGLAALAVLSLIALPGATSLAPGLPAQIDAAANAIDDGKYSEGLKFADILVANASADQGVIATGQALRAEALNGLGRADDSHAAAIASVDAAASGDLGSALINFYLDVGDGPGALATLNRFLSRFDDRARDLDFPKVRMLLFWVKDQKGKPAFEALIVRLADGGFGGDDIEGRDSVALNAARIVAERGDMDHARSLAQSLMLRSVVRDALTQKTYEALWPVLEQSAGPHMERIGRASLIEAGQSFQRSPDSSLARLAMFRAEREAGLFDKADQLAAGFATKPEELAKLDESGGWLVNDHAYLLAYMGKLDAADARFAELTAQPITEHPWLINMMINRLEVLVGHHREAQALLLIDPTAHDADVYGSPYARQLIRRLRICVLHGLGRDADAAKLEPDLTAHAGDAPAATTEGYFCLGRKADGMAMAIKALGDPDQSDQLIDTLQPDGASLAPVDPSIWTNFANELSADPGVAAAFVKVGRPLPPDLWPNHIDL